MEAHRYVWLDGEIGALKDALRGEDVGDSAGRIVARILAAAALPGRMSDPPPLDPWWVVSRVGQVLSRRVGRPNGSK